MSYPTPPGSGNPYGQPPPPIVGDRSSPSPNGRGGPGAAHAADGSPGSGRSYAAARYSPAEPSAALPVSARTASIRRVRPARKPRTRKPRTRGAHSSSRRGRTVRTVFGSLLGVFGVLGMLGGLLPDYAAVATATDAVHLTAAGWLTTADRVLPVRGGWTLLAGWSPDETYWFHDVLTTTGDPQSWAPTDDGWRRVPGEHPDSAAGGTP